MQPERIRVDNFLLADGAQAIGGKLYVLGGGWNFLNVSGPDSAVALIVVAGRIVVPFQESGRNLAFSIQLKYVSDEELLLSGPHLRVVLQPKSPPDQQSIEIATPFALDLPGLTFPRSGEYAFVVSHEGEELARTRFQVNFTGFEVNFMDSIQDVADKIGRLGTYVRSIRGAGWNVSAAQRTQDICIKIEPASPTASPETVPVEFCGSNFDAAEAQLRLHLAAESKRPE